jgi:hypothetical protein
MVIVDENLLRRSEERGGDKKMDAKICRADNMALL